MNDQRIGEVCRVHWESESENYGFEEALGGQGMRRVGHRDHNVEGD